MNRFRCIASITCLLTTSILPGRAQEASTSISTERPGVSSSPDLIPRGSIQFENGTGISFQSSDYVADLPETLIRFGIFEHAEARFLMSNEAYQKSLMPHVPSFQPQDPAVSLKVGMGRPNRAFPRSTIFCLSLPRGGHTWTSASYDPSINAIWSQTFGKRYFFSEDAGVTLTTLAGARRAWWTPSVAGGAALSHTVTVFGEYAPAIRSTGDRDYTLDGGFSFVHRTLTQFDVRAGYLDDTTGYHALLSAGYSIRRDSLLPRFGRLTRH